MLAAKLDRMTNTTALRDGEIAYVQGSAAKPYTLKNIGGVFSCSCPAWRNQSRPIELRTCKHLKQLRGEEVEFDRIGEDAATAGSARQQSRATQAPPILLAERWEEDHDPTGWWLSEKLDGVRAYWNGETFLSRAGNRYHAPTWFVEGLGDAPLDGELWLGRQRFQETVSVVRRQDESELWRNVRYVVFDLPASTSPFEGRLAELADRIAAAGHEFATVLEHEACRDIEHLRAQLSEIEALGGEGLMLRQPGSKYASGRSSTLLKVKSFLDAEARVLEHLPGKGRHKGRMGALRVELRDGTNFSVGSGFTDAEREAPPEIEALITFRYQELTNDGVPRFPTFVGVRDDVSWGPQKKPAKKSAKQTAKPTTAGPSEVTRLVLKDDKSDKFWQVRVAGDALEICYGRNGTDGRQQRKEFSDAATATNEAAKLIAQKTKKGYVPE